MSLFQYRELIENGSGLVELALLTLLLFVILVPFFAVWGFLRRRSLQGVASSAGDLAAKIAIVIFVALPICVILLAVPFAILNMIGVGLFHQEYYWPLIMPGLLVIYGIGTIVMFRTMQTHRRKEREKGQKRVG